MSWEPVHYSTKANLFICFNSRKHSLGLFRRICRGRRFRRDRMHRDRNLGRASWRDSEAGSWAAMPFSAWVPTWEDGVRERGLRPADGTERKQSSPSSDLFTSPCSLCLSVPTQELSAFRIPRTVTRRSADAQLLDLLRHTVGDQHTALPRPSLWMESSGQIRW